MDRLFLIHSAKEFLRNHSFRGKRFIHQFLDYLMPKIRDDIVLKTRYNFKMKIHPLYDKGIERNIFYTGAYEKGTLLMLGRILKKGDVVIDIGANIGLTTLHSSLLTGKKGKVYALEPNPKTFKLLNENVEINSFSNIETYKLALFDRNAEGLIYDNIEINRGASSLYTDTDREGQKVELVTLDYFIETNEITKIDFIKIDAEGAEVPILFGATGLFSKSKLPVFCVEYSSMNISDYDPKQIFKILRINLNYKIFKQKSGKDSLTGLVPINSISELPAHDNIYCFQESHLTSMPENLFYFSNYEK